MGSRLEAKRDTFKDSTALRVFVPQCREVQKWVQKLMELEDTDDKKFWVEEEWITPPEGFANAEITEGIAPIRTRQGVQQKRNLKGWEELEGNESLRTWLGGFPGW